MFIKTKAIVLQTIKFSETSVISKLFTQDLGLISFVVNGVRSAKAKNKSALFQPMTILQIDFNFQQNKNLQYFKEYKRDIIYEAIPFDMAKTAVGLFLIEVLSKIIREQETNHELFDLVYDSFSALDKVEKLNPDFHLQFLMQLTKLLGFEPHTPDSEQTKYFNLREGRFQLFKGFDSSILDEKMSSILLEMTETSLFAAIPTKLTKAERKEMLYAILNYFQYHIENFPVIKSLEVLETVFGG